MSTSGNPSKEKNKKPIDLLIIALLLVLLIILGVMTVPKDANSLVTTPTTNEGTSEIILTTPVVLTPTPIFTPTGTPIVFSTKTSTFTSTNTHTKTPTPTETFTFTPTWTFTFTPTWTSTFTPTPTEGILIPNPTDFKVEKWHDNSPNCDPDPHALPIINTVEISGLEISHETPPYIITFTQYSRVLTTWEIPADGVAEYSNPVAVEKGEVVYVVVSYYENGQQKQWKDELFYPQDKDNRRCQ